MITYLESYTPTPYIVPSVQLTVDLINDHLVRVTAVSKYQYRQPQVSSKLPALVLDSSDFYQVEAIYCNDQQITLSEDQWGEKKQSWSFQPTTASFELKVVTSFDPTQNHALMGFYATGGFFCTQHEADGFRRVTLCYDRPDILSIYEIKIIASARYPYLLANGDLVEKGELEGERHYVRWSDPFPKPCYLIAFVIGDFDCVEGEFCTKSGRQVLLQFFVDRGKADQVGVAMESLKKSMTWDEERFDLEYDLSRYMVVATSACNMGAMENKGLNLFNAKYVLGHPDNSTDEDLEGIESVIAHEYLHNWTGNRVTCRDWFQLTLKEGLTVFRDQEFTSDLHSASLKRMRDVKLLKTDQFEQDSGPLAHSIRPRSYGQMNNLYTVTVYEKGAEIIRMMMTLVGREGFKRGLKFYLSHFDGQAVTTEDFLWAMSSKAGGLVNLLAPWYEWKGTPQVKIAQQWDQKRGQLHLTFTQTLPAQSMGSGSLRPVMPIPLRFCFWHPHQHQKLLIDSIEWGEAGAKASQLYFFDEMTGVTSWSNAIAAENAEYLLFFLDHQCSLTLSFTGAQTLSADVPVASFNRGFSAPVELTLQLPTQQQTAQQSYLATHDDDAVSCAQAFETLWRQVTVQAYEGKNNKQSINALPSFVQLQQAIATSIGACKDPGALSQYCCVPTELMIRSSVPQEELHWLSELDSALWKNLGDNLKDHWWTLFQQLSLQLQQSIKTKSTQSAQLRRLRNLTAAYLVHGGSEFGSQAASKLIDFEGRTVTDEVALLNLAFSSPEHSLSTLQSWPAHFEQRWQQHPLLMYKWLSAQASSKRPGESLLALIQQLEKTTYFDLKVPNGVYALYLKWSGNYSAFYGHQPSVEYFLDRVKHIDSFNPQVAARLLTHLRPLHRLPAEIGSPLRNLLEALGKKTLSTATQEILVKYLHEG